MGLRKTRKNRSKKIGGGGWPFSFETPEEKTIKDETYNYIKNLDRKEKYQLYWKCRYRIFIINKDKIRFNKDQTDIEKEILLEIKDLLENDLRLINSKFELSEMEILKNINKTYINNIAQATKKIKKLTETFYREDVAKIFENNLIKYLKYLENPRFSGNQINYYERAKDKIEEFYQTDVIVRQKNIMGHVDNWNKHKENEAKYNELNKIVNNRNIAVYRMPDIQNNEYVRSEPLPTELLPTNGGSKKRKSGTKKKRRKIKRI